MSLAQARRFLFSPPSPAASIPIARHFAAGKSSQDGGSEDLEAGKGAAKRVDSAVHKLDSEVLAVPGSPGASSSNDNTVDDSAGSLRRNSDESAERGEGGSNVPPPPPLVPAAP